MASLTFLNGITPGRIVAVEGDVFRIGRHHSCRLVIDDLSVSAEHAELRLEKNIWSIRDLESSNGTSHNGSSTRMSVLHEGDRIAIGDIELRFHTSNVGGMTLRPEDLDLDALQKEQLQDPSMTEAEFGRFDEENASVTDLMTSASSSGVVASATIPSSSNSSSNRTATTVDLDMANLQLGEELIAWMSARREVLYSHMGPYALSSTDVVDQLLTSLLARGHALLKAPCGLGRSALLREFAGALDFHYNRIVCSFDLTGDDLASSGFFQDSLAPGDSRNVYSDPAAFSNTVLAKDVEATPRKTQEVLFSRMMHTRFEVGGYGFHEPFFLVATRNDNDSDVPHPLSHSQRQEFAVEIRMDYPERTQEEQLLGAALKEGPVQHGIEAAFNKSQIIQIQDLVRTIPLGDDVLPAVVSLLRATRPDDDSAPDSVRSGIVNGISPRVGQVLVNVARAHALLDHRLEVTIPCVLAVVPMVLCHRMQATSDSVDVDACLADVIATLS